MLLLLYHKSPEVANSSLNGEIGTKKRPLARSFCLLIKDER